MVFDAQNGPQLVIRGISTALKMLNLPQKHPFFTFEAKKPLKQRVGAHFEHQKSFIYIKTCFFVLWLYSNSFNEGPTPYGIKRANLFSKGEGFDCSSKQVTNHADFSTLRFVINRTPGLEVMTKKLFWPKTNFLTVTFQPVVILIPSFECGKICMVVGLLAKPF